MPHRRLAGPYDFVTARRQNTPGTYSYDFVATCRNKIERMILTCDARYTLHDLHVGSYDVS